MSEIYIVKKVFLDKDDKKVVYPLNSFLIILDEGRKNDLVKRGLVEKTNSTLEQIATDNRILFVLKSSEETLHENGGVQNKKGKKASTKEGDK